MLILYFSGVGNTKMVATGIGRRLTPACSVSLCSVEAPPPGASLSGYDALVLGFPTFHAAPAKPMLDFLAELGRLRRPIPALLFTTCGLYSANALRSFAQRCIAKNILPILSRSYRCAATDGVLLAPFMPVWFGHEKQLWEKVSADCARFLSLLDKPIAPVIPPFKLYSILNAPNKWLGSALPCSIWLHRSRCLRCQACVARCPTGALWIDSAGYPIFMKERCIHCYRCIHHCPAKALSLFKRRPPAKTLV